MRYTIVRGDTETTIEIDEIAPGRIAVAMGGRRRELDVRHLPGGRLHVVDGAVAQELAVHLDGARAEVSLRGQTFELDVYNDRALRLLRMERASAGSWDPVVKSPMAGKVIAVKAEPGQIVDAGDALVIIEAMKMENVIRAPHRGRVEQVDVRAGAPVEGGAQLVVLSAVEEAE